MANRSASSSELPIRSLDNANRFGHSARVSESERSDLSVGEIELLIDGLSDDISFSWALIDLGLRGDPAVDDAPPSTEVISIAFAHFERLLERRLVKLGRVTYVDPNQPRGTVAPVMHLSEPIAEVRDRVEKACSTAEEWGDWAFSCWLVTTDAGDVVARQALDDSP